MAKIKTTQNLLAGIITILISLCITNISGANLTLQNTAPTNWGYWGSMDYCPPKTYAGGFQLKVQGRQWRWDDTALNAIKLLCVDPMNPKISGGTAMSKEGAFGEWGYEYKCEKGLLTGFQLESEGNLGQSADNTAANNLRVFCSNPATPSIDGDGMNWGSWGGENKCLAKQAICGLQTQVSWNLGTYVDNVGLNNVHMQCCDIPFTLTTCQPKDSWELVKECDNLLGTYYPLPCKMDKKRGVEAVAGMEGFLETMDNIGFTLESQGQILSSVFASKLKYSNKTGHDWSEEGAETWGREKTKASEFMVPIGKLAKVYQVVGTCGPVAVRTGQFKKDETDDPFATK